jgi:translation initiation factor IF-2
MVEGWGGDVVAVEVSAKTKVGIETLLDMILLVADVEDLRAPVAAPAEGLVIEAHMERGRGPVAHALVTSGTLHDSDYIIAGASYGKIRSLNSPDGARITSAGPSSPVVISGLRSLPEFADTFTVVRDEKSARSETNAVALSRKTMDSHVGINSGELISMINRSNRVSELPVLLKADVQGSLTSVIDSLKTLDTDEVIVRIVSSGVGSINESDIHLAHTAKAVIYGFNVPAPVNIMRLANRDHVTVKLYDVIYELINDAKEKLSKLLAPEIVETETGRLIIKGIFKTSKTEVICGGEVTKGKIKAPSLAKIIRAKQEIAEAQISNVKRGPQDAKEVIEGEMCGLNLQTKNRLELVIGDEIVALTREMVERTL